MPPARELIRLHGAGHPVTELAERLRGRVVYLRQTNPGAAAAIERTLAAANVRL